MTHRNSQRDHNSDATSGARHSSGDSQPFNFFDIFKPHHGKHSADGGDGGHGKKHHNNDGDNAHGKKKHGSHDSGNDHGGRYLPELTIDHGKKEHHGKKDREHNEKKDHHEKDKSKKHHKDADDSRSDTGLGSWFRHSSSSDAIAKAAARSVGHSTYLPRKGSDYYGSHLPKTLGCTSASTNMLFDGLKAAGKVSDKDYRKLHQVGNDTAYEQLQKIGIAKPVSGAHLKPGDWAYFSSPHRKHGHSGVVFEGKNGELMVANNKSGKTVATPLSTMMHKYSRVRGLRAT